MLKWDFLNLILLTVLLLLSLLQTRVSWVSESFSDFPKVPSKWVQSWDLNPGQLILKPMPCLLYCSKGCSNVLLSQHLDEFPGTGRFSSSRGWEESGRRSLETSWDKAGAWTGLRMPVSWMGRWKAACDGYWQMMTALALCRLSVRLSDSHSGPSRFALSWLLTSGRGSLSFQVQAFPCLPWHRPLCTMKGWGCACVGNFTRSWRSFAVSWRTC